MVSIIITTYKREPKIVRRAIESVIAQTYKDWELWVIDDSPADYELRNNVKDIFEYYKNDCRINYFQQAKNSGACAARNVGINLSKGEFLAFLDDDDEWIATKLEKQVNKFLSSPVETGLIYCGCFLKNDVNQSITTAKTNYIKGNIFSELTHENYLGGASFPLIKKSCLEKVGLFDPQMLSCQDLDLWLRISREFLIDYVEEPLVIYHMHEGEQITKCIEKVVAGRERILYKNRDYFNEHPKDLWVCLVNYAYTCAYNGSREYALYYMRKAVKTKPFNIVSNAVSYLRIFRALSLEEKR